MKSADTLQRDTHTTAQPDFAGTPPPAASSSPSSSCEAVAARPQVQAKQQPVFALRFPRQLGSYLIGLLSLTAMTLLWYLATRYRVHFIVRFENVPDPVSVLHAFLRMAHSHAVFTNVWVSIQRVFLGFGCAAFLGVGAGLLIGRYPLVKDVFFPILEVLRPIPAIAWVPMSIMLWPTSESSIIFITFLGAFFPIVLNTYQGVCDLDPVLIRAAKSLGADEKALLWEIILPGVLPSVFTGLALGMGIAWVSLIAAEMISGQFGIGYFTWEAYTLIQYADIAVGMILIGLLGLLSSSLIRYVGRLVMPWTRAKA